VASSAFGGSGLDAGGAAKWAALDSGWTSVKATPPDSGWTAVEADSGWTDVETDSGWTAVEAAPAPLDSGWTIISAGAEA
jgi:hypothetical protein